MGIRVSRIVAALLALGIPVVAHAAPLPQPVAAMIDAAADDPDTLKAVVKAAKKANPDSVAEIDAEAAAATQRAAVEKAERTTEAGFLRGWTTRLELGGSIKTGNTEEQAFTAGVHAQRETPRWGHDLDLTVDRKIEDDELTTDRYFLTYSAQRKFSPRFYVVGVLWGERDTFAGYDYRFSESVGLGYRLIDAPNLKLRVEAGPGVRQADYLLNGYEGTVAIRSAGYLTWRLSPSLEFTQSLVSYLDTKNSTLLAASALTTKLQDNISAKASYELRNEANPPAGRRKTDTTSRLTLLFGF